MGDSRRFSLMADAIARRLPPSLRIADVAGGKGGLQAELYRRGFRDVVSWDVRKRYAKPRRSYHRALFDWRSAPRDYGAVVGMHPDAATDHIVRYAVRRRIPFVVCPCCVLPSASAFQGVGYEGWLVHLERLAFDGGMRVEAFALPMAGRNVVLAGAPGGLATDVRAADAACRGWEGKP